jgi:hypothetical protein
LEIGAILGRYGNVEDLVEKEGPEGSPEDGQWRQKGGVGRSVL